MINFNKIKIYLILIIFIFINQCADWRVATKAARQECHVPSVNHAFLSIAGIEPTGTTKDLNGLFKYFTYTFKQPFFDLEDRCRHANIVIAALNNNNDFIIHRWNNKVKNTGGKIIVTLTKEFGIKICRDYYTYIHKKKKRYVYQGTACTGKELAKKSLGSKDYWVFYPYKTNQSQGRPILESWGTLNDNDHPDIKRSKYHFHCRKTPWRFR